MGNGCRDSLPSVYGRYFRIRFLMLAVYGKLVPRRRAKRLGQRGRSKRSLRAGPAVSESFFDGPFRADCGCGDWVYQISVMRKMVFAWCTCVCVHARHVLLETVLPLRHRCPMGTAAC